VTKNLALTKHYMLQSSFVCSTALLKKMPASARDFFLQTVRETAVEYGDTVAAEEEPFYQQMKSKGMTITEVNLNEWQAAIAPLYTNNDLGFTAGLKDRLFKEWQGQLETQGISFVADMYNGFRSFYTTTSVKTVKDLSGLRIRGFGNAIGNSLAKYFGFANIGITWGEVLPGIQQKTLDGCEVQVATAYGSAIYEVAKNLALTKHYMLQSSFVCSTTLLKSMPAEARDFFLKTLRDTAVEYGNTVAAEEEPYYQQMKDKGMTVTEVDLREWQAAIAPLYTNNDLGFTAGLKDRLFKELGL
jgi:TRAP-type C4-dicarboxylate transport system substrate-binding protein